MTAKKVLIRTYPPNTNANYGGILQAWALARVIRSLGYVAYVDATIKPRRSRIIMSFKQAIKRSAAVIPSRFMPLSLWQKSHASKLDADLLDFAKTNIDLVSTRSRLGLLKKDVIRTFDAFVVGSDQVWRPDYVNVREFVLDFLPDDFRGPKIAYAASFGTASPQFSNKQIAAIRPYVRRFTSVSVREKSGVELCRRIWHVEAQQTPDPTLLLSTNEYLALTRRSNRHEYQKNIVSYILDLSPFVEECLRQVRQQTRFEVWEVNKQPFRNYRGNISVAHNKRPSITEWLSIFSNAHFIVTDSFHGVVFSIIFEKQFVAIVNYARGADRMRDLLSAFGLEERLWEPDGVGFNEMTSQRIDWEKVRLVKSEMRDEGRKWLAAQLSK